MRACHAGLRRGGGRLVPLLVVVGMTLPSICSASAPAAPGGRARFAGARLVEMTESPADADGHATRIRILDTRFKYPLVRVEESVSRDAASGAERVSARREMVADHIIVKLRPGKTQADLARVAALLAAVCRARTAVSPSDDFHSSGRGTGPFTPSASKIYTVTNAGTEPASALIAAIGAIVVTRQRHTGSVARGHFLYERGV
jgi:hypothetical protein